MSLPSNAGEYVFDAGKLMPSAAATTAAASGYTLNDWVAILTIVYTALMIAHLFYKFIRERRNGG